MKNNIKIKDENGYVNINKLLGVSDKWLYLEGFVVRGDRHTSYEVFKFGLKSNYPDDIWGSYYYKEKEDRVRLEKYNSTFQYLVKIKHRNDRDVTFDKNEIIEKFYINHSAQWGEKYKDHIEDVIKYLRENVSHKLAFMTLEEYFKKEEYMTVFDIFPKDKLIQERIGGQYAFWEEMKYRNVQIYYPSEQGYLPSRPNWVVVHDSDDNKTHKRVKGYMKVESEYGNIGFLNIPYDLYLYFDAEELLTEVKRTGLKTQEDLASFKKIFLKWSHKTVIDNGKIYFNRDNAVWRDLLAPMWVFPYDLVQEYIKLFQDNMETYILEEIKRILGEEWELLQETDPERLEEGVVKVHGKRKGGSLQGYKNWIFYCSKMSDKIYRQGDVSGIDDATIKELSQKYDCDTIVAYNLDRHKTDGMVYLMKQEEIQRAELKENLKCTKLTWSIICDLIQNDKERIDEYYKFIPSLKLVYFRKCDNILLELDTPSVESKIAFFEYYSATAPSSYFFQNHGRKFAHYFWIENENQYREK